jgi:hypothetical protein
MNYSFQKLDDGSWGIKVSGNLDETTRESGKTVYVSKRRGGGSHVTLGAKVTSWNGGRASVYRIQPDHAADAERHRRQAAELERKAQESYERSDTDGFVSQWASGMNAQLLRRQAEIDDAQGQWEFERTVLERLDGQPVVARHVHTRYGDKWRIDATDEWLPYQPKRVSTLAKYGYREVHEREIAPAKAMHWAPPGARGLSGATLVQVVIRRTDEKAKEGWRPVGAPPVDEDQPPAPPVVDKVLEEVKTWSTARIEGTIKSINANPPTMDYMVEFTREIHLLEVCKAVLKERNELGAAIANLEAVQQEHGLR